MLQMLPLIFNAAMMAGKAVGSAAIGLGKMGMGAGKALGSTALDLGKGFGKLVTNEKTGKNMLMQGLKGVGKQVAGGVSDIASGQIVGSLLGGGGETTQYSQPLAMPTIESGGTTAPSIAMPQAFVQPNQQDLEMYKRMQKYANY